MNCSPVSGILMFRKLAFYYGIDKNKGYKSISGLEWRLVCKYSCLHEAGSDHEAFEWN